MGKFKIHLRGSVDALRRALRASAATLITAVVIAGCAKAPSAPPGPDPKAAAHRYLAALKAGDYQTCYGMLAKRDLDHGSLDEFLGDVPMAPNVERRWFGQIESATEYRTGIPLDHGSEVIVPVNVKTPNLVIWERMLGVPGGSRQTVQAKAEKQLGSGGYPWLGYADQIVLVKEAKEWHLVADFAQRARVAELHEQALSAYHAFDYDRALSLYRQIQELLETAPFSGSGALSCAFGREMKAVEAARASGPAAQSYLSRLALKNIVNKPATSGAPGLFGQITNSGDRALDQVELTVSYGAEPGKPVYSEKHLPIATPLEFTDFNLPIVPFNPKETRDFGIALKAPMQIQEQNKPTVMVTGIIFSEPPALSPKLAGVQVAQDHEHGNRTPGAKAIAMPGSRSSATSKSK